MRSRQEPRGGQGGEAGAGARAGEGPVTGGGGSLDRETEASFILLFFYI